MFSLASRKIGLITSLIVFAVLAALIAISPNGRVMDVLLSLAGVACAANIPVAVGILSLTYQNPSRRRNMAFSSFLMGAPVATIGGGLGSGGLSQAVSWKASFIGLGVLYVVVSMLAWVAVPRVTEPRIPDGKAQYPLATNTATLALHSSVDIGRGLREFDWVGLLILSLGILLFTVALTIGPEGPEPWKTPTVIFLLTAGVLAMCCFAVWETVTRTPMVPPSIWKDRSVSLVSDR
jgi:MFS family permease